jgi:hypothetical protein
MVALVWDSSLQFHSVMFARRSLSRSGGQTISGVEQVVQSATDFWAAKVSLKIRKGTQALAYRALQAQNWGRAGQWIIPVCSNFGVPASPPPADFSFSDDWAPDFSIGPAPPTIPPGEGALTTADAIRGDRTITFQFVDPTFVPLPGMFFSIGNRLYLIGTVTYTGTVRTYTVTFVPSLRADAATGTSIEFSSPRCLMRLAEDNIGDMDLDMLRFADITLSFVEVPA